MNGRLHIYQVVQVESHHFTIYPCICLEVEAIATIQLQIKTLLVIHTIALGVNA